MPPLPKAPTVSHHLARLKGLGLVGMRAEGNTHIYWLDGESLRRMSRGLLEPERMAALAAPTAEDTWERKVLRDFFVDGRRRRFRRARSSVMSSCAGWRNNSRRTAPIAKLR